MMMVDEEICRHFLTFLCDHTLVSKLEPSWDLPLGSPETVHKL